MYRLIVKLVIFFFFKQKTAYEMLINDWNSDVCSSYLRRPIEAGRRDVRYTEAGDTDLVHGADAAYGGHRQRARKLRPLPCNRQCRQDRHRRQHLSRPRQRAGCDGHRARCRHPAVLLRPDGRRLETLVARLGGRLRLSGLALRFQGDDGDSGPPDDAVVRWRSTAEERRGAEGYYARPVLHGPAIQSDNTTQKNGGTV